MDPEEEKVEEDGEPYKPRRPCHEVFREVFLDMTFSTKPM